MPSPATERVKGVNLPSSLFIQRRIITLDSDSGGLARLSKIRERRINSPKDSYRLLCVARERCRNVHGHILFLKWNSGYRILGTGTLSPIFFFRRVGEEMKNVFSASGKAHSPAPQFTRAAHFTTNVLITESSRVHWDIV